MSNIGASNTVEKISFDREPQRQPKTPVEVALDAISEDARKRADTYVLETVVPEGGE